MTAIPDGTVDMVFADLPYGVTANKWDTPIDLARLWASLLRIAKQKAAFVFTATQPFATTLINSQNKLFRYDLVWDKCRATGYLNSNKRPLRAHEHVLVFATAAATYNPQKQFGHKPYSPKGGYPSTNYGAYGLTGASVTGNTDGSRYPRSVLRISSSNYDRSKHPTQKPVALLEWLIKTYSNPGDTILDPVMGSGTTGVACINTQRRFLGMELDAAYFATANKRIREAANATA